MRVKSSNICTKNVLKNRKNHKRQILNFAFFVFFILFTFAINEVNAAVLQPNSDFYVNDNAGILTSDTKQYIMNTNVELEEKTGAQIVVVTVKSLGGKSIEEYANELFNSWEIGDNTKNNGLLLLCSYGDRQFRVEVGYGLEGKLPDGKTGRMQDEYIIPYLKEDNFDEGIRNGYSAFLKEVADEYGVTITGTEKANKKSVNFSLIKNIFYLVMIIFFIYLSMHYRGRGGPFIFFGGGFHGGGPGGFSGGGFSGGGFSGRRWTFRWRRKQPKFLKLQI